jgi:hypothetical protein
VGVAHTEHGSFIKVAATGEFRFRLTYALSIDPVASPVPSNPSTLSASNTREDVVRPLSPPYTPAQLRTLLGLPSSHTDQVEPTAPAAPPPVTPSTMHAHRYQISALTITMASPDAVGADVYEWALTR